MLISFSIVLCGLWGCSSSGELLCSIPQDPSTLVVDHAITLEAFHDLSAEAKADHRARADEFLDQAKNATRSDVLVTSLAHAAGLAPDNGETWLKLAHVWRWVGDYSHVELCLEKAMATLKYLDDGNDYSPDEITKIKRKTSIEQALLWAWLHYDRGEWTKGLRWARKAEKLVKGSASVRQINGLLLASLSHKAATLDIVDDIKGVNVHSTDARWILATLDRSQNKWGAAFNQLGGIIPNSTHVAECYRDMGFVGEYLGHWSDARRWYKESGAALPISDKKCLTKRSANRLDTGTDTILMPMWLAFGRYYVTGSRSAYASWALTKFDTTHDSVEKDFWGGQVVNTTGILIRWDIDKGYAFRARGLVFLAMDKTEWGLKDLKRAAAMFAKEGRKDARTEGALGHAKLLEGKPKRALVHLRSSISIDPGEGAVWSDLGMALVQLSKSGEAERALTMAVGLDSSLAAAWYNRGLIYIHRKEWALAELDLVKAAELAPENHDVATLLQRLKQKKGTE